MKRLIFYSHVAVTNTPKTIDNMFYCISRMTSPQIFNKAQILDAIMNMKFRIYYSVLRTNMLRKYVRFDYLFLIYKNIIQDKHSYVLY